MEASTPNLAAGAGDEPLQLTADLEAGARFSSLEKSRQVLVFQTIQEAISAVPPRLEADFPRVVAAYNTLTEVVEAAAAGQLSEEHLAQLEAAIDAAGGVIAPGLWSQGDSSVAAFRAATFGMLRRSFKPAVADAACAALNARLQVLRLNDLGMVFRIIASFFSPLTPTSANTTTLQAFEGLDPNRQVLVFRTIQDATQSAPPRSEATFASVVSAFQAELQLLHHAAEGQFSDDLLAHLEASIEAAGGVLSPGTYAQGDQSIASFRAETLKALQTVLPGDVFSTALSALNVRLNALKPARLADLFKAVRTFFLPLLQGWNSPTLQTFKTLDPERQALVFRTIELAIGERPDLENTIFASSVKAVAAERSLIDAADRGQLSLDKLQALQSAIEDCGGVIAPKVRSSGEGSLGDFIESCFLRPGRELPNEVRQASIAALNAKLASTRISSFADLEAATRAFMKPLIAALLHGPSLAPAARNESLPPASEPLHPATDQRQQPLTVTLVPPLEREQPGQSANASASDSANPSSNGPLPQPGSPADGQQGESFNLVPPLQQEQAGPQAQFIPQPEPPSGPEIQSSSPQPFSPQASASRPESSSQPFSPTAAPSHASLSSDQEGFIAPPSGPSLVAYTPLDDGDQPYDEDPLKKNRQHFRL